MITYVSRSVAQSILFASPGLQRRQQVIAFEVAVIGKNFTLT
jgi:hypothetical protein